MSESEEEEEGRHWKPNEKHGFHSNHRGGYYESLPDKDQAWIDAITEDLVAKSYFDMDDKLPVEKLRQVAVDLHQRRDADEYIGDKGLTRTMDVGYHEDYGPIQQEEENVLMVTKDRLSRESRMTIKDFGVLDQSKSQTEEAAQSLVESLSEE